MTSTNETLDRLEVRFIAEPAASNRPTLPGGWWIWCLLGIVIGIASWELGASYLSGSFKARLTPDQPAADAILAVEGLELLGEDSALDIVDALKHPDERVARAAFNALNRQLAKWQMLEPTEAQQQMQALVGRLDQMSSETPAGGLILASGLASRVFTYCLEQDDVELRPLIRMCETVIKNTGIAANSATEKLQSPDDQFSETRFATQVNQLQQQVQSLPENPVLPSNENSSIPSSPRESALPGPPLNQAGGSIAFRDSPTADPAAPSFANSSNGVAKIRLADMQGSASSLRTPYSVELSDAPPAYLTSHPSGQPGNYAANQKSSRDPTRPTTGDSTLEEQRAPRIIETSQVITSQPNRFGRTSRNEETLSELDAEAMVELEFQELVSLLASHDSNVAQNAAYALKAKGLSDNRIVLASRLATGSAEERLQLVQNVAQDGSLDPRPWLLWMAREGETEVRVMAISLLANMLDQDVARELRMLLNRERDSGVQQVIRQTLVSLR